MMCHEVQEQTNVTSMNNEKTEDESKDYWRLELENVVFCEHNRFGLFALVKKNVATPTGCDCGCSTKGLSPAP